MSQKKKKTIKTITTKTTSANHSPTLKTIKMVENILKNLEFYTIKFSELKRKLPKQVNHNTLKEIIRYLEQSGKVYTHTDGITWIYNPSKKLQKAIENSYEFTPERINKWTKYVKKYDK
jgi:hypothetical protein